MTMVITVAHNTPTDTPTAMPMVVDGGNAPAGVDEVLSGSIGMLEDEADEAVGGEFHPEMTYAPTEEGVSSVVVFLDVRVSPSDSTQNEESYVMTAPSETSEVQPTKVSSEFHPPQ